jgi:hypothetical protein
MVERRNIGLKIVVGLVTFDLLFVKFAVDASQAVSHPGQLTWIIRAVATGAFITLAGMLTQIEIRSARDRRIYRACERRIEALQLGTDPSQISQRVDPWFIIVRDSWATTWPLAGFLLLTAAIWWLAGILTP